MKPNAFGSALRQHRIARGLSQLELALSAGSTQRQVSFLETGRTRPHSKTLERLVQALGLSPPAAARLRWVAGLAPMDGSPVAGPPEEPFQALLEQHAPWPALLLDGAWTVLEMNGPAQRLCALLGGRPQNMAQALFAPGPFRDSLVNWGQVAPASWERFCSQLGPNPERAALIEALAPYVPDTGGAATLQFVQPIFRIAGRTVRTYSLQAGFAPAGSPDPSRLQAELLLPADPASGATLMALLAP